MQTERTGQKIESNKKLESIEGVRELFVDPTGQRANELSRLVSLTIDTMQEIYRSSGHLKPMNPEISGWLQESTMQDFRDENGVGNINVVLGQILARETQTRRFDNKFFGQIHPQGNEIAIVSNLIAAFMNTNTVFEGVSMSENLMEEETLDWFADMFGYNKNEFSGNIVTGGTEANETAFWVAREWKRSELAKVGRDPSNTKLYVLGSEAKHYSIVKICHKLNLEFIQIPEKNLKTDVDAMEETIKNLDLKNGVIAIVLGIAGGTETGMVDDLSSLLQIAKQNDAHFHVDAAYGGPYILTEEKYRFNGINEADSITIDPHKMLYTPYEAGAILFKDKARHELITSDFINNAGYLQNHDQEKTKKTMAKSRNYGSSRPSGSLGTGGVISTWATMKLFGHEGIATLLEHTLDLTKHAHSRVESSSTLEAFNKPELNTLLIRLKNQNISQKSNNEIVDYAIKEADRNGFYISCDDEISHGRKILRFLAMHPYSTKTNVDELFDIIEKTVKERVPQI